MAVLSIIKHEFAASALAPDAFRVAEFVGEEHISQPYRFEIRLVSNDPDIEFKDVINQPATLTMYRSDEASEVNGIVVDFEQGHKADVESEYRYTYRVVLAPRLWRCELSSQSRIFQHLTVEEIVSKVLDDAGVDHQFNLTGKYEPREYTTQYKESDLQFIQRLLEYEGILYYFKHADGAETLILSDKSSDSPAIDGAMDTPYRFQGGLDASNETEVVLDFMARQQLVTGKTKIKDYNYRTPEQPLLSDSALNTDQAVGIDSDFGIHVMESSRGDRLAVIRNEEIEATRLVMTGLSDCLRFRAGQCFALTEHYREGLNQKYLITRIRHSGSQAGAVLAGSTGKLDTGYSGDFACVPASVPYRPPQITPVPKLPGVLTAKVESSGGDYAPIDDQGRYRIRFPFDLGDAGSAQATKPVRLAQPYSGPEYGQHFPVHKDAEMVVACVDGNVDRILGLATIPNPNQASPVTSANQTENTVRTAADNHIVLQDLKGTVGIDISTPTAASRIHIGAAENSVVGIQSSTQESQTMHGGQGIYLKAGSGPPNGAILASSDIKQLGSDMTVVDGLVAVALAALGGNPFNASFRASVVNAVVGTAAGLAYPGIYGFSEGGVMFGTPAGISHYAGAGGISMLSATGVDIAAATLGINLLVGNGGINLGVGIGDIHASTGSGDVHAETKVGDVKIEAHTGRLMGEAQKVVQLTSKNENIQFQAPDSAADIKSFAGRDILVEAKKNVITDAGDDFAVKTGKDFTVFAGKHARITAEDQLSLVCGQAEIVLTKNGDITIKNSGNKIELKAAELKIEGGVAVKVKGTQVAVEGTAQLDLKASGIATLKGSLTKVG